MMEEERWVMHGLNADDPNCIKNVEQLQEYIEKIGFLPLFRNEIPGFSVEEHTAADSWWSEDPESDPWEWRKIIAGNGRIAYGKFFDKKAGFISRGWLPAFANYRRDGYDFDARWDDELASIRSKKITQERMTGISPLRGLDRKPRRIYSINWTDCLSTAWNMPEEMMINR